MIISSAHLTNQGNTLGVCRVMDSGIMVKFKIGNFLSVDGIAKCETSYKRPAASYESIF